MRRLAISFERFLPRPCPRIRALTSSVWLLATILTAGVVLAQEVPGRISYDGQLADENGQLITNGAVTMKFALYDASSGGAKKWPAGASEDHVVSVQSGLFSVVLGSKEAISTAIFADSLFLEIQVNDGSGLETLSPRQPFLSAPYALRAATADGIAAIDNLAAADLDLKRNSVTIATLISSGFKVNGVLLVEGTIGGTPVSGAGTRLMWVPAKGAFRAGAVTGTAWDDANIGTNSTVAGGLDNTASNTYATAGGGQGNTASGIQSAVGGGQTNTASGSRGTVAGGSMGTASGLLATVGGGFGEIRPVPTTPRSGAEEVPTLGRATRPVPFTLSSAVATATTPWAIHPRSEAARTTLRAEPCRSSVAAAAIQPTTLPRRLPVAFAIRPVAPSQQ